MTLGRLVEMLRELETAEASVVMKMQELYLEQRKDFSFTDILELELKEAEGFVDYLRSQDIS